MKTINHLLISLSLIFSTLGFAQKVVVVGMNHVSPDGLSFVATQTISSGEIIYFSEDEYNNATNAFSSGESVTTFTATTTINVGDVVFIKETATNTLTVSCTNGVCGTAVVTTVPFALGSGGEQIYAYSDTDADPTNGVTEIYSVMYTIAGNIPALEDPIVDFPNAIVVDGFGSGAPDRTEFNASRDGVSKTILENPANYTNGAANADLNIAAFTNLNLSGTNPVLTLSTSAASSAENSGGSFVFTFTLDSPAVGNLTVNFTYGGSADESTDYSQSGADTFAAGSGTATISGGTTTTAVIITPSGDTDLEPDETVVLTIAAGTGYDAGSPSQATSTILNDDTNILPALVAVTGASHSGTEGFSFVALTDITPGTQVYFTDNEFDNSSLSFNTGESTVLWQLAGDADIIPRGTVIVASENSPDTFTLSCGGLSCGGATVVSGSFDLSSEGESFSAYSDSDSDGSNGILQLYSTLYTGPADGSIPSSEDPTGVYTASVLVDGFSVDPILTEYNPALRNVQVDQANFQNISNWIHPGTAGTLSDVPFDNIIISEGSADPSVSVAVSPASVLEDSGTGLVYTFTMNSPSVGSTTVNFTIGGTATYSTDYTDSGADTFDGSNGSVIITNGNTTAAVTLTPVADADVEVQETIELMIDSGTGYIGGSPNAATGEITNDDTSNSDPLVAITGLNHNTPDGFSFVAAQDIPGGTEVYFTEEEFDNTTLVFDSGGEAVLKWTVPGAGIPAGDVIVVSETAPDVFSLTCNGASGAACGTITLISGNLATASNGETFYAYADDDPDPSNGVVDIYAVLYTGNSSTPGGSIPAVEDPSGIFLQALVVDGFPAIAPNRTEYDPTKRNIPVYAADFENLA
ncbi:MAG: hypothetical protein KJO25_03955, partial [Bacteroidia bacterium]|nr:hypothetical protein [Bacteroidia bacterium]